MWIKIKVSRSDCLSSPLLFPSPAPVYLCVWTCGHGSSVRSSGEVHLQIIPLIIPWYITPVSSPLRCQIVPPVMVTISRASNHCVPPQTLWILINSVAPQPLPPLLLHLGPDTKTWQNKKYDKEWLVGQSLNQSILIVYGLISSQKPDFCQGKTKITQKPLGSFAAGKILKCFVLLFFSAFCHLLLSLHLNELKVLVLPRARCVDYPATCKSFLVHHRSSQTKEGSIQLLCQNVEVGEKKPSTSCFLGSHQSWKTRRLESLVLTDAKASHWWQKGSLLDVVVWWHFWQLCCRRDEGQMWLDDCS